MGFGPLADSLCFVIGWGGGQLLVMLFDQQVSMVDVIDWLGRWANKYAVPLQVSGLGFILLISILVSPLDFLLGILVGIPFGFLARNTWKIGTMMSSLRGEDGSE